MVVMWAASMVDNLVDYLVECLAVQMVALLAAL